MRYATYTVMIISLNKNTKKYKYNSFLIQSSVYLFLFLVKNVCMIKKNFKKLMMKNQIKKNQKI